MKNFTESQHDLKTKQLAQEFLDHRSLVEKADLVFELDYVDTNGPVPFRKSDTPLEYRQGEWLPVLKRLHEGEEVAWYGPVWFTNEDKNGKKEYVGHNHLNRMHLYAWECSIQPECGLTQNDAGGRSVWLYKTPDGNKAKVPEITDEFGNLKPLHDIPFK